MAKQTITDAQAQAQSQAQPGQMYSGRPAQPEQPVQSGHVFTGQRGHVFATQPSPGQPGQAHSGQPAQGSSTQPYSGQPYSGQPYPGQPYSARPASGQSGSSAPYQHSRSSPIDFDVLGAGAGDPRAKQRRLRPVWMLLSIVMLVGGVGALVGGIVDIVRTNGRAESSAVARGRNGETLQFTAPQHQAYTVYIVVDTASPDTRDRIVSATSCGIRFADGGTAAIRGSRQVSSTSIGDTSSVGYFDAPEGRVAVDCVSRYSDRYEFFVSPGTNDIFSSIGLIFGGIGGLIVGVLLLVVALRRRRPRSSGTTFAV